MMVWIVFEHWEYEGSEVKSVWPSEAQAEAEARRLEDPEARRCTYYTRGFKVEAPDR